MDDTAAATTVEQLLERRQTPKNYARSVNTHWTSSRCTFMRRTPSASMSA